MRYLLIIWVWLGAAVASAAPLPDLASVSERIVSADQATAMAEIRQLLGIWDNADSSQEIELGEVLAKAWQRAPAEVGVWFDQHPPALQHWLQIQDYLWLSLEALYGPEVVGPQVRAQLKALAGSPSAAAKAYLETLRGLFPAA